MLNNILLLLVLITTFSCLESGKIKLDEALKDTVIVTPANFSNSLSSVSLSSASLLANGVDASTINVTLRDMKGDPISGVAVLLNSNRGSLDTISPFYALTDSNGVASFTVKSLYSGTSIFSALETQGYSSVLQTASVTFTQVPVSASVSTVSANLPTLVADGVANARVMVFLLDASGNPVVGKTVTLSSSRTVSDTITPANGVTNSQGLVNFTVRSSVVGPSTYTAYNNTDSISIMPSVAVINYIVGPPALISIDSGNNQSRTVGAALTSVIRVKVTDSTLNTVTGATVNWAIATGSGSLSAATSTTNSSGLAETSWTVGQTAGTNTVTATINGTSTSTTLTATGVAGATVKYRVSGFPSPVDAGTSYSFTVTAQDIYNNTVTTNNSSVTFTSSDSTAVLPASSPLSSGVGTFSATLNKYTSTQWIRANGDASGAQTGITVVPGVGTPYELEVAGAVTSFNPSTCQTFTVNVLNSLGNAVNSVSIINVDLYEAYGTFYSDNTCTTIVNSVQVPNDQSSATFYYKNFFNQTAGPIAVVDRAGNINSGILSVSIIPGSAGNIAEIVSSASSYGNYVLLDNGLVWGFGYNSSNNLLNSSFSSTASVFYPVPLKNLGGPVLSIASGQSHSCALISDGTVKCWGYNGIGQLGNGTTTSSSVPVSVSGITTAVLIGRFCR